MIRYGELSEDERQALPLGTRLHPFDGMPELTLNDWGVWRDEKGVIHSPSPHQRLGGPSIAEALQDLDREWAMSSLLAVYDPTGRLGLTDPSPGGGSVPVVHEWVPLPAGLVPEGLPCSECPGAGMEEWKHVIRHHDGRCSIRSDRSVCAKAAEPGARGRRSALLLRTEDGTPDPVGMARAREVLARVMHLDPREGVCFALDHGPQWFIQTPFAAHPVGPAVYVENAPEALARLLAEHAGCEVIRG